MPEIAEVCRTVHFIRKHLLNKTIAKCTAVDDPNVYGKNLTGATTGAEFQQHLTGRKIIGTGQQGKYFWLVLDKPPHPVMHFGMSGWLHFKSEETYYYRRKKGDPEPEWPPKFWKFQLETKAEGPDEEVVEAAFADMRRFARIRLVDCAGHEIRNASPLVENGPDPVVDKDKVTLEWLRDKCSSKKVPIKAMLLDQANISGIGNWVGDEIMYNAKIHPEQYANTLGEGQIERLLNSIHYVCGTACDVLGDSEQFPDDWLFKHRWGKGKKDAAANTLPTGEKIQFLTVGGRTSAVVPSVQKKTGPVAKDVENNDDDGEKPKKTKASSSKSQGTSTNKSEVSKTKAKDTKSAKASSKAETSKKRKAVNVKAEEEPKPQKAKTSKVKIEHASEKGNHEPEANGSTRSVRRSTRRKA